MGSGDEETFDSCIARDGGLPVLSHALKMESRCESVLLIVVCGHRHESQPRSMVRPQRKRNGGRGTEASFLLLRSVRNMLWSVLSCVYNNGQVWKRHCQTRGYTHEHE